ncbi:Ig-like domain-containing protein [Atopomonas hussainii]|uniref:Ig-like domain-containing protein n=1 Tax=Atopomonas hussainii TaxID=1429083 RepID=UPI001114BA24|nr:Ig-like domain-containing protein [Atopomonas hussainii]
MSTDEGGEQWEKLPIEVIEASGADLTLRFSPYLKAGRYRIDFHASLASNAGATLGEEQRYEFTVAPAELLIKNNTNISELDSQHDGKQLIVDGATLTLAGAHYYDSVVVRNSGVITSPVSQRVSITAEEVEVDATSRIDVSARGQLGNASIGNYSGGSYGGAGGVYQSGSTNPPYGDFREPKDFGTGGRQYSASYTRGGGAIELRAGLLKLEGLIQANGQHANSYGSGSGGSLLLHADTLELGAEARIEASGGGSSVSTAYAYGGGGGGRVALYYGEVTQGSLHEQVLAKGGLSQNTQPGAAGSIYLKNTTANSEELVYNNTGVPASAPMSLLDLTSGSPYSGKVTLLNAVAQVKGDATFSAVSGTNGRLLGHYRNAANELVVDGFTFELDRSGTWSKVRVINGGVITTPFASNSFTQGVSITADEVEVDATSRIDVSARGQLGNASIGNYTGGSHGGAGGVHQGSSTNAPYGDFREPKDFGTGGRQYGASYTRGGGVIELRAGLLKLEGLIQANGQYGYGYGSGSGGSLLLHAQTLQLGADARIEANGGGSNASNSNAYGGGGGGRVALYYGEVTQGSLHEQVLAKGGLSQYSQPGAAGSIYLKNTTANSEELVYNNTGVPASAPMSLLDLTSGSPYSGKVTLLNAVTQVKGDATFSAVSGTNGRLVGNYRNAANELVVDGFTFELDRSGTWSKVRVINGGVITTPFASNSFTQGVSITADEIEVDATSRIDVSARGRPGNDSIGNYTGGSYGGSGGIYSGGATNAPYGDFREPKDFGTGGRYSSGNNYTRGGGAIELRAGLLKLDGAILANGQGASHYGSGSGGSLLLHAQTLQLGAAARIQAIGGGSSVSNAYTYGGGGGGRVALYYGEVTQGSLHDQVLAKGGLSAHAQPGAAGSIYLKNTTANSEELVYNNTGVPASAPMSLLDLTSGSPYSGKITLLNAVAQVKGDATFSAVSGTNGRLLGYYRNAANELVVDGFTFELGRSGTWSKVRVINGGVITTPVASDSFTQGITITADEVEVDATSRIDVSGKGSLPSAAVGNYSGGSHGGLGGVYPSSATNEVYGDYLAPITFGVGGRYSGASSPNRGGGALKLVTRTLKLDGQLLANGGSGSINTTVGGGAGGSLWVDTQALIGSATTRIQANGGNGLYSGGSGGGGRIAVYYAGMQGIDVLSQISVVGGVKNGSASAAQPGSLHLENRVVSTAVAGSSLVALSNQPLSSFTVDFINAVETASVAAETVRLTGPNGPVAFKSISAVNTVRFQFDLAAALPDGAYELRVGPGIRSAQGRGMDQNGNGIEDEDSDTFVQAFVVDRLPPNAPVITAPLVAPAVNALNTRKVTLSGTRDEQTAVLVNGVVQVALGSGAWSISNYALAEGTSELRVQSRDLAGNTSAASVLNFSVDSLAPSFQQFSHSGALKEVPASVWVRFSESGSGLDFAGSSLILKRGSNSISGQLSVTGDVLRLTPSSTLLEGAYSVTAILKDKAGNTSNTSFSFTLDYTAPAAPGVNAYPALTSNKQLLISGVKEHGSRVHVFSAANTQLTNICCSGTTWQYNLVLEPGDNQFTVTQTDAAGNVSPATTVQVRFDNEAPGPVLFTLDPKGSGTEVKLAWPSYDEAANGNDIQQYRVYSAVQAFSAVEQAQLLLSVPSGQKQVVVKNLPRNEERYFAVVAVDQQGLMLNSVTAQATTPEDVQAPTEPLALVVNAGATQLNLTWQASVNAAGDLAGYALYVGADNAQRIDLPLSALSEGLRYSLSGLAAASANPLRLVAVDEAGNESAGVRNPGITWLNNPQDLQLEPLSNRFDARWAAVQPAEWVSAYRVYVADEPFSSIQGKTAKAVIAAGQLSASVSGLLNNKAYHVAVTAVNTSGGENPQVQSVSVTPTADAVGPELVQLTWHTAQGAQNLTDGGELSGLGEWRIQAKDESGIGRVELSLNGQLLGQATQAGSYYRYAWDLSQVADGDYTLGLRLQDTLDNVSQREIAFEVALAAPAKPTLSLQSKASKTNKAQQVLLIQGQPNTLAQVSLNGAELADVYALNSSGQAQVSLALAEGDNQLTARLRYSSRERFGAVSEPLTVTLDTALPNAPSNVQAVAKAQGIVQLSWSTVNNVAGYNVYIASQPFDTATDVGVSKLGGKLVNALSAQHQPTTDGTYYYRVSSQNALGSESALSALQSARVDRTPPKVEQALFSSQGPISSDGRFAPGRIDVRLRMSEPLRNAPFFSMDVAQGVSIPVRMSQAANEPLFYQGSFDLTNSVPSGLLYARVSAYDLVGNEGSEVVEGKTLRVDTQGPDLAQLSLLPESPVENLVANNLGRELQVVLRLSEDPAALPQLTPQLDGQAVAGQASPLELVKDAQSQPGAPIYSGRFRLPANAGEAGVQLLGFVYQATDDLGNTSQRIQGRREFQVYQGDLPPLDVPLGLSAKALAGGRVALEWKAVKEASAYQLYRRANNESDFVALGRVRELSFEDNLPAAGLADGVYFYRLVSVREHDGKEALSLPSDAVKVQVLSQAPSAPRDLSVELNGAGIVLRWLAPEQGQVATYNLYRANVGQGQAIEVAGLTPLQSKIPERIALDSRPSDTEHAYTVTAVDAAGNESAAAQSVYLNAGLLPVRDLSIRLNEGQAPALQWDHSGKDVAGYNVYYARGANPQKLNSALITGKSYSDESLALPFAGERLYSVTAVDAQGVESLPHALLLPALKAELRAEQKFERGVFNQLFYRVANSGTQELKRLRLRVTVNQGGQNKQHLSDYFDVAAGTVSEVPVVVAGYHDLPGVVPLQVDVLYAPQVGELVTVQRSESITAGENTLLAQVLADEFTRGATGSVRLRLENPSAVATELVTARANGSQASTEMRLVLEDLQGNVLATQPVKASVGNGLVTVRDGRTVARVGAFDVLEAGPFTMQVPAAAPEKVRLRLEADFLHYQTALPSELVIAGLRSSRELTLVETPYYGEISEITPQQVQSGDSVTLRGRAVKRSDNQPLANVELKLILSVRGFEQVITVNTDAQGLFTYQHKTNSSDSGSYQVSLIHPSIQERPQQGQFLVQGAAFSPPQVNTSFPRNYEQTVGIVVEAGHDTPLKNVRLEYVQPNGTSGLPAGLKVQHSAALNLAGKQRGNLTLRISGDNSAAASGLLDYRIIADGLARPIGQTRISYNLVQAQPVVRVAPMQIRTGMSRDSEQVEQITLSNTGLDVLRNVRIRLLDEQGAAAPSWVSLRTSERMGDLPVNANNLIGVAFKPTAAVPEGDHYITLRIESDNAPSVSVPMSVAVTQSGKGGVIFQVEDIYTGTLDAQGQRILGLKGAKIKLQNRNVLSTEFTASSDARGQVLLENIPAGEYSYRISAWDHDDITGQLWIKPGVIADERVFLMSKLVTVEWSVKEIALQDRYEVILNATFKTNVPTALVMIEPLSINLPVMRKGDVFQGELTLTNYGLIRADNVSANLPSGDARTKIEYLRTVPNTLEAGDVVVIPYRIVALQSFDPDDELNGAAGCWGFSYHGVVNYQSQCANGQVVPGSSRVTWSSNGRTGSCGGPSTGGGINGGGAWGGWLGGPGGAGGGWGFIPSRTPLNNAKQCPPPKDCETCNKGGANGGAN